MGLDDAIGRIRNQDGAEADAAAQRADADRLALAHIQAKIDELAGEALSWLRANPRSQCWLAFAEHDGRGHLRDARSYRIVYQTSGWILGGFFLHADGILHAYSPRRFFDYGTPPTGWDEHCARAAANVGVPELHAYKAISSRPFESCAISPLMPSLVESTGDWSDGRRVSLRDGVLRTYNGRESLEDLVARGLSRLSA